MLDAYLQILANNFHLLKFRWKKDWLKIIKLDIVWEILCRYFVNWTLVRSLCSCSFYFSRYLFSLLGQCMLFVWLFLFHFAVAVCAVCCRLSLCVDCYPLSCMCRCCVCVCVWRCMYYIVLSLYLFIFCSFHRSWFDRCRRTAADHIVPLILCIVLLLPLLIPSYSRQIYSIELCSLLLLLQILCVLCEYNFFFVCPVNIFNSYQHY